MSVLRLAAAPLCNKPSRLLVAWLSTPSAGICIPDADRRRRSRRPQTACLKAIAAASASSARRGSRRHGVWRSDFGTRRIPLVTDRGIRRLLGRLAGARRHPKRARVNETTCQHCGHPAITHGLPGLRCELCGSCPGLHSPPPAARPPGYLWGDRGGQVSRVRQEHRRHPPVPPRGRVRRLRAGAQALTGSISCPWREFQRRRCPSMT